MLDLRNGRLPSKFLDSSSLAILVFITGISFYTTCGEKKKGKGTYRHRRPASSLLTRCQTQLQRSYSIGGGSSKPSIMNKPSSGAHISNASKSKSLGKRSKSREIWFVWISRNLEGSKNTDKQPSMVVKGLHLNLLSPSLRQKTSQEMLCRHGQLHAALLSCVLSARLSVHFHSRSRAPTRRGERFQKYFDRLYL